MRGSFIIGRLVEGHILLGKLLDVNNVGKELAVKEDIN